MTNSVLLCKFIKQLEINKSIESVFLNTTKKKFKIFNGLCNKPNVLMSSQITTNNYFN